MAVSRERHVNDAGINSRGLLWRETEIGERARAIALRKNIGPGEQVFQTFAALVAPELKKSRELAAAGINRKPRDCREIGARNQKYIRAVRRQGASGHGTC